MPDSAPVRPVVVVTGASSGIGREVARVLARRGMRTVVAARRLDRLMALATEIEAGGGTAFALACDVRRWADAERMARETVTRFGRIDVLVNAAGYGVLLSAQDTSVEQFADLVQTNLMGAIHCTKAVLPTMLARRAGTIANVASLASVFPIPRFSAYGASKAGLVAFSDALRYDVRPHGIEVVVVCPAAVATEFFAHPSFHDMPSLMRLGERSATAVAEATVRAIERARPTVTVPRLFGLALVLRALFPGLLRRAIGMLLVPRPVR
jgi:short-subunit dehydrogenase